MKQLRIVTAVCAFSLSIAQVKAKDQFLVDKGKANAEIIISESPARSTRLAAAELQTYVAKISGAQLPIETKPSADVAVQIYIGESPYVAKLGVSADCLEHGADRYSLYNLARDPSESNNLAAEQPEKLRSMMQGMVRELKSRNAVYPVKSGKKLKPVIPEEENS